MALSGGVTAAETAVGISGVTQVDSEEKTMTNMAGFNRGALTLAVCVIVSTLACSADSTTSAPDVSGSIVIERLDPTPIQGIAGSTIDPGPAIRVKDKRTGQPLADVSVEFIADSRAGTVDNPVTKTDASGIARAGKWVLSTHAGQASILVRVNGVNSYFFADIRPDVPTRMRSISQDSVGFAGEMLDGVLVNVSDRYGNGTPGIRVTFAISAGDGTLGFSSRVTDFLGYATTGRWRLGSSPGENTVVASAEGVEPQRFTVQGIDSTRVMRFTLDSVRQVTRTVAPAEVGLSGSTLYITPFDQCLCRADSGYYIVGVGYNVATTLEPARISGSYSIAPPRILVSNAEITSVAIVNGRLEVGIQRDNGDFVWDETWIYGAEVKQSATKQRGQ